MEQIITSGLAREIMGENFFGIEEIKKCYKIRPSSSQINSLAEVPYTKQELEESKDTHILVTVLPLSVLDIRIKTNFHVLNWYDDRMFAKERNEVGWYLVRKTEVLNSKNKTWQKQLALLRENAEVPKARILIYTIMGYYFATGKRLFPDSFVRTSSEDLCGFNVTVGNFTNKYSLIINSCSRGAFSNALGIASCVRKKFNH